MDILDFWIEEGNRDASPICMNSPVHSGDVVLSSTVSNVENDLEPQNKNDFMISLPVKSYCSCFQTCGVTGDSCKGSVSEVDGTP